MTQRETLCTCGHNRRWHRGDAGEHGVCGVSGCQCDDFAAQPTLTSSQVESSPPTCDAITALCEAFGIEIESPGEDAVYWVACDGGPIPFDTLPAALRSAVVFNVLTPIERLNDQVAKKADRPWRATV